MRIMAPPSLKMWSDIGEGREEIVGVVETPY
jgi:hypothetical protein